MFFLKGGISMDFETAQHLHIGYYENGLDIEVTAYKVIGEDKWVFFIDGEQNLSELKNVLDNYVLIDNFGYKY
jgi:Protein of unknown function (DUF3986)